jgi:hypothetical protein
MNVWRGGVNEATSWRMVAFRSRNTACNKPSDVLQSPRSRPMVERATVDHSTMRDATNARARRQVPARAELANFN